MPVENVDTTLGVMGTTRSFAITLICAEELPPCPADHVRQDPYAVLEVGGGRVYKTRPDRLEPQFPVWNKTFYIADLPADDKYAAVFIFDDNLVMEDTLIARTSVDLDALSEKQGPQEIELEISQNQPGAKLKLTVSRMDSPGLQAGSKLSQSKALPTPVEAVPVQKSVGFETEQFGMVKGLGASGAGFASRGGYEREEFDTMKGWGASSTGFASRGGSICKQETFTVVEDRPVIKERRQYILEHHPVEREMVVETRTTGRERGGLATRGEFIGREERVVRETRGQPCPPVMF